MILSKNSIVQLIQEAQLISDYQDINIQAQANGFDLTVEAVREIETLTNARIGFDSNSKCIPTSDIVGTSAYLGRNEVWYREVCLQPGYYLVDLAETIKLPNDLVGITLPRTSLFRMGSYTIGGFYDRGYHGKPQCGLVVTHPIVVDIGARIIQIAFITSEDSGDLYSGSWQHHRL